jgi:gentisate 1,2-dioxygenase
MKGVPMTGSTQATNLPAEYESGLRKLSLGAAWTQLRNLTPQGRPIRNAKAMSWHYADVRPKLIEAGRIVPIELAERRVLALINGGVTPARLATTPSIFIGLQLILPGEFAPAHKHTPAAARLVIEGDGASTTVNGEKLPMEVGDLLLTPPHHWHEHRHEGTEPMIWMDILDHPVGIPLETSYLVDEEDVPGEPNRANSTWSSEAMYAASSLVPFRSPAAAPRRYPMMRFPWRRTREALIGISERSAMRDQVHLMFVNPESGASLLETMCFSVRMLRPGEEIVVPRRSASAVFQILEGDGECVIDDQTLSWSAHDTVACPTFAEVTHRNASNSKPAFLLQVDDGPLQHKLGFYEEEAARNGLNS